MLFFCTMEQTLMQKIGSVIQQMRKARGVSQERLALDSGVDRRYMSDVENGKRNISIDILERLARYFGVSVAFILYRAENPQPATLDELKEWISNYTDEEVLVFDSPDYISAFLGLTHDNRALYDYNLMLEHLVSQDGMDYEEAADFISYNTLRSLDYGAAGDDKMPVVLFVNYE